ncbi:MAG TPA: BON domain-containing protein [Blastocatellia bacterium]|nr:BON domain-containing protein [Blastocatellia bacterium]
MDILLRRKANGLGINVGLRLLAFGLSFTLLLLITYYFLVVNRSLPPSLLVPQDATLKTLDAERRKADAALIRKVKSAISQTKRLHGYSIGIEYKDGVVTLSGEVPTEIDKDLAATLAREISGSRDINNQIRIAPEVMPQAGESLGQELAINVDDLELQANLRERIMSVPELKPQRIEIKVQNRIATLSGTVASEALKMRAEQVLRNYPKVASVTNQLRIGSIAASSSEKRHPTSTLQPFITTPEADRTLAQKILTTLSTNRADFSNVNAINATTHQGEVTLSGVIPSRAERALAERLTKEIEGVKSVKNLIVIGTH